MKKVLPILIAILCSFALSSQVIYVDADATGANDGTTWQNAYNNLSEAIDAAQSGDQLWVAAGIYYPTHQPNYAVGSSDPRFNHFTLKNGVSIFGGFAGDETSINQRDLTAYKTVISGDIDQNDNVGENGYVTSYSDVVGSNSLKLFYFPTGSTIDSTALLDGFVLAGAVADNDVFPYMGGAAMLCQGASPKVVNSEFYGNYAKHSGGAIWIKNSSMTIENCTFSGNYAESHAGAVYFGETSAKLKGCTFTNNSGKYGGAVYVVAGNDVSLIEDCDFNDNEGRDNGGAISIAAAKVLMKNSSFTNNIASVWGGGIVFYNSCEVDIVNCTINSNHANDWGGGIGASQHCDINIINTKIQGNTSINGSGGGIGLKNFSKCNLYNSLITGNKTDYANGGDALYLRDGAIANIVNTTIAENNLDHASILLYTSDIEVNISNSILYEHGGEFFCHTGVTLENVVSIVNSRTHQLSTQPTCSNFNPLFHWAPNRNYAHTDGDWYLWGNSPANNKGINSYLTKDKWDLDNDKNVDEVLPYDINGNERVFAGICDLGCYEQQFVGGAGNALHVWNGQKLQMGNGVDLSGTDFTIEMWVSPNADQLEEQWHSLCGNNDLGNNLRPPSLFTNQYDRIHYGYISAGGVWNAGDTEKALKIGQWNHIAMTFNDATNTISIYANGKFLESLVGAGEVISTPLKYINCDEDFRGFFDEFRIWKEERTLEELTVNMNKKLNGNEPNLELYYSFDQVTGDGIEDLAGDYTGTLEWAGLLNSNAIFTPVLKSETNIGVDNFTINWHEVPNAKEYYIDVATDENFENTVINGQPTSGANSYTVNGLSKGTVYYYKVTSKTNNNDWGSQYAHTATKMTPPGNALAFDEQTYVDATDVCKYDFTKATMECWVKIDLTSTENPVVFACNTSNFDNNYLLMYSKASNKFFVGQTGLSDQLFDNTSVAANEWHHVALTIDHDGGAGTFYLDGVNKGSFNTNAYPFPYGSYLSLGQEFDGPGGVKTASNFLIGEIDEFRVWNKVLTQSEIQSRMNISLRGNETNLVTYYNFDLQTGTKVIDNANVFDGEIVGNVNWIESGITSNDFVVEATSHTVNGFTLTWEALATPYTIDVATDAEFANKLIDGATSNTTSYDVAGLAEGVKYYFRVTSNGSETSQVNYTNTLMHVPGNALWLDGKDDYVDISQITEMGNKGLATMECWVYVDPTETHGRFLAINTSTGGNKYLLSYEASKGYCLYDANASTTISSYDFRKGAWVHLAVTMDGADITQFYMNGELVGTATNGHAPLYSGNLISIGQEYDGTKKGDFLKGGIDEVRFWDVIRTEAEIKANMHKTLAGTEANLLAYYDFDQSEGQFVYEKVNGIDGSIVGNPEWKQSNAIITPQVNAIENIKTNSALVIWNTIANATDFKIEVATDVNFQNIKKTITSTGNVSQYEITALEEGTDYYIRLASETSRWSEWSVVEKFSTLLTPPGNALAFDGIDGEVNIGYTMNSDWSSITLEAWVKLSPDQINGFPRVIGNFSGSGGFALNLWDQTNQPYFEFCNAIGNTRDEVKYEHSLADNVWHHIASTYDGTDMKLYLDGELVATHNNPGAIIKKQDIKTGIGNQNGAAPLKGTLDEIRIWDVARTEAELKEFAHKSLVGDETNLVAYYNFDKAEGTTFKDEAGNFDGTMSGGVTWAESKALITPFTLVAANIGDEGFTANWAAVPNASKYILRVATDKLLTQPVEGMDSIDAGNALTYDISGLTESTNYYYGVMSITDRASAWSPASDVVKTTGSSAGELAINLEGNDNYLDISAIIPKLAGKNAGAITGWFKAKEEGLVFRMEGTDGHLNSFWLWIGNANYDRRSFVFEIWRDGNIVQSMSVMDGNETYLDDKWHHIAIIIGDGNNRILLDGKEKEILYTNNIGNKQTQEFTNITNPQTFTMGKDFSIQIDEFAFYKNPITNEEAIERAHNKLTGSEVGLVAYYNFDNSNANDVAFGRNGTEAGTVSYERANVNKIPFLNETVQGVTIADLSWEAIGGATEYVIDVATDIYFQNKIVNNVSITENAYHLDNLDKNTKYYYHVKAKANSQWSEYSATGELFTLPGKSLKLDGVDDYLVANGITNYPSNEATFECWVKADEKIGNGAIWANNHESTNVNQYVLAYVHHLDRLVLYTMESNNTTFKEYVIPGVNLKGSWHHIAVSIVKDGISKVFVDGKNIFEFTHTLAPIVSNYRFSIGQEWDGLTASDFFKGEIDEFRVWNIALTQEQVWANMNLSEPEGANEHYIAHYTFDEIADGNTIFKDWAKYNNAAIVNGATNTYSEGVIIPITFQADNETPGSFDLHINNIASAASFEIEVAYDSTFVPPLAINKNIGRNLDHTVDGLCPGVKYYFRARAIYNEKTLSNWSTPDTISTINEDAIIQNLEASEGDYSQNLKITWECTNSYLITDFEIKRRIAGIGDFEYLATVENNADYYEHVDTLAEPGTYYEYTIQGLSYCYNNDTKIDTSNIGFNIPTLKLSKEINNDTQEAYIRLDWQYASDFCKNVEITRVNTENGITQTLSEVKDSLVYRDAAVELCTPYTYQLVAKTYDFGDVKSHTKAFTLEEDIFDAIDTLDASKGYFDNKIVLNWKSYKQNIIDRYEISRRKYTSGNSWSVVSVIENGTTQVWIDEDANAGEYYEYLIVGYGTCGETILTTDSVYSVGFRQPEGIVSGLVTYKGGNPVADVRITANYDETSKNYGSCVEFDGNDSLVIESRDNTFDFSQGMTLEMWARPLSLDNGFILFKNSGLVADYTNDGNLAVLSGSALASYNLKTDVNAVWDEASWNHIAIRANTDSVNILINGISVASNVASTNLVLDDSNLVAKDYAGYLDELRIWNIARTDSLIQRYYNYMIPREKDNLVATLRFDENLGSYAFDHTRKGGEANKVHGYLYGTEWSKGVPAATKLALAAQTNSSGNYIINGIWFKGSGETFSFTPSFGVHEFDPGSKSMLISENSLVYGDQNFTDISAFEVKGNVKYLGTTFPVEKVQILLDGNNMYDIENNIVTTDRDGNFSIEVPIGDHVLSVRRDGHFFADGFYPPKENGEIVLHNFQDDITGLQFTDSTTRIIAGRVIGGAKEGDKEIGFGKSVNNIGQYTIDIKAQREEFGYTQSVTTDYNTGEYEVKVIPEIFVVENVLGNPAYMFDLNMESPIDMTDKTAIETVNDTVITEVNDIKDTTINKYNYHHIKNWIYRTPMSIDVTKDNGNPVICDSIINPNGTEVAIYDVDDNGNVTYNYGQPVFAVAEYKTLKVIATEQYTNYQTNETFVAPVTDATIKIKNNLAIDDSQQSLTLNDKGIATYTFMKGAPNLTKDDLHPEKSFTKTLEVKAERTGESVNWMPNNGDVYRAVVLGVQVTGTNFVTQGPDRVDFVLRDPPGSNSNSYVEEGFTMERTETKTKNRGFDASLGVFLMAGPFTGGPTFNHESTWTSTNTSTESVTFNTSYSTSDDPAYVGAMGDVFFGRSTNITYGLCKQLSIFPVDSCHPDLPSSDSISGGHKIGQMFNFAMGDEIATTFVFTQNHIENYLIPDLIKLRNNYFVNNPAVYALVNESEKESIVPTKGYYTYKGGHSVDSVDLYQASINAWVMELVINEYQKLSADGDVRKVYDWGFTNMDWGIGDATVVQFGDYQRIYFTIGSGKSKTAANIKRQFNRNESFFNKNISFDAGAVYESSMTSSTETSVERTYEFQTSIGFQSEIETPGIKIPFIGRTPGLKIEASASVNFGGSNSGSSSETKERTVGYTLSDGDQGDYFSVDVAKDAYGNGPIFITRGGQSACPYEGVTETHFFNEGTLIGSPTMQIEVPTLLADQSMVSNVPEDLPAVFTLKLGNQSEIEADNWFMLMVDVASNPYGAKIKMDGASINNGTAIMIPGGTQLTKTIELEKGRADVNEYEDIRIIMHSMCQYDPTDDVEDIADTVVLSAHFVPVCTDVEITHPGDDWLVNVANNDTLDVRLSGYDLQLSTFEKFVLQYKAESDANWLTDATFFNDPTGYEEHSGNKYMIDGASFMLHSIDMQNLRDRNYMIRAVSVCNDASMFESEPKTGVLDGTRPTVFGTPSPADGILSPNDEIMITFNEPVEAGLVTQYNFDVKGVLNGSELNHGTSVAFDGEGDYAETPSGIRLSETDFAVEFWMQKPEDATGTVISQGSDANNLFKVGFTADSMLIEINNKANAAFNSFDDGNWHHYAVVYNYDDLLLTVYVDDQLLLEQAAAVNESEGPIYFGMANATNTDYLDANVHDMRIWRRTIAYNEVIEFMNSSLSGNEIGLNAYWPMNEGDGNLLVDKAHSRHANASAGWNITPASNAYAFNGTDQALAFGTGSIPITNEMDFTVEFWFKGAAQSATLFSNGNSAVESGYPEKVVNININDAGQLVVETNNETLTSEQAFADDTWHHLAFVVNRRGYANLYVDAEKVDNLTATAVGSLQGVESYIGARGYIDNLQTRQLDNFFSGVIDEVRIWSVARTQEHIDLYKNYKLNGSEIGLKAYYPFETYEEVMGVMQSTVSLEDFSIDPYSTDGLSYCGAAVAVNDSTFTALSPNMKRERAVSNVSFDYVVNNDQIIITPTDELAKIEKCILEITVQGIKDMHGNEMASPVTWTAYVKKNQVVWGNDMFDLEKELSESLSFTTTIVNEGGTQQSFSITNLPNWLSVNPEMGSLDPDSEMEVEFTVNDALNIGNYTEDVFLVSNSGYNERLTLDLRVYKQAPSWVVDETAYQSSMNIIAQLSVKDVISNDKYDKIAVFSGDVCRGVCNLEYKANYDAYFAFLVVYGNTKGEELSYRVWDASEGKIYSDVAPTYNFEPNKFYGTVATPVLFTAGNKLDNTVDLNKGWNWLSFNLEMNEPTVKTVFNGLTLSAGDIVKHAELFSAYDASSDSWIGSLSNVALGKLYRANVQQGGKLLYMGAEADVADYPIELVNGWNRIGYIPSTNMTVNEALAGFEPQVNDVVKSQYQFAMYDGFEWIGSLNYMEAGKGYMYQSNNVDTLNFVYPKASALSNKSAEISSAAIDAGKYEYVMNITAQVLGTDIPENAMVQAYVNGELRGVASISNTDAYHNYSFITVYGSADDVNADINFKLLVDNVALDLEGFSSFAGNAGDGDLIAPVELNAGEALNIASFGKNGVIAYPNPFNKEVTMHYSLSNQADVKVEVYNILGEYIDVLVNEKQVNGNYTIKWDGNAVDRGTVKQGVYFIHITAGEINEVLRVVKE